MPSQLFNLYTSNNGTLAESQAKISSLAVTSDEYNSLIFDRKRHSIWAQGEEYGRGSDAFDKAANSWTATIKGQTWSRILYVPYNESVSGASYLLQIQATRSNVVYNETFIISAYHNKYGRITKINGSDYSDQGIQIRVLSDSNGNSYIDIYDDLNSISNSTTQLVKCSFIGISTGSMNSAYYYTVFTDDTTIPTNFAIGHHLYTKGRTIEAYSQELTQGLFFRRLSDYHEAFSFYPDSTDTNKFNIRADGGGSSFSFWTNHSGGATEKLKIDQNGHLLPGTNNSQNIGSSSLRWANIYSVLGNFSGQITSSVATGTAPFAITSTTVNTNLNADMVDGLHAHTGGDNIVNNEANKLIRTDQNGYTRLGWINTTSGNFTGTPTRIYASNDSFIRYMTPANFFPTLENSGNNISITVGGQNRTLTVGYSSIAGKISDLTSSDAASSTTTWRRVWFCYNDNVTGRPAYDDNFAYKTNPGILKVKNIYADSVGDDSYIAYPVGGNYTDSANKTGAICITLPVSWTSTMMSFDVDIFNYAANTSVVYHIAGYNYNGSNNDKRWVNTSAYCLSNSTNSTTKNLTVRFGHNGSKCCVYIGETNTSWSYPQVQVRNVRLGFNNYAFETWHTGWVISFVTSFGTLTSDVSITNTFMGNGYIGTTPVQSSSNNQALTGITSINGCVTITSGSDIASIGFIGNHSVEFGNSGYAHRSYYFRPAYSASGATQTNLYIQNASAAASPTFTTTHSFTANGNAYHSGNMSADTVTIRNTTATGHIIFSRASWNYLTAPASGSIAFVTNGKTAGSANTDLVVKNTEVSPGTNLYSSLGSTSVRWNGVYSSTGNFSGNVTGAGFVKTGSSDSYVLLGGGGHKAISDFVTSLGYVGTTQVQASSAWQAIGGITHINRVKLDKFTLPSLVGAPGGWYRMGRITNLDGYLNVILYCSGTWHTGAPTTCIVHMSAQNTTARLTYISGITGNTTAVRLVNISGGEFYFDVHVTGVASDATRGAQYYTLIGNYLINERLSPTTTVAASSDTAGTILNFPSGYINGINITSSNYTNYTVTKTGSGASGTWGISITGNAASATNADTVDGIHANRFGFVYNSANYGGSSSVTVNDMAADGNSNAHFGMIYAATDNPVGSANWLHVWSQTWSRTVTSSWVSQIALGVQQGSGMWYRTTSGNVVGRAWIRVLDSSNYTSYAHPKNGKISIAGGSYSWYAFQQYNSSDANPSYFNATCAIINITSYSGWQPWIRAVDSENGSWAIGQYTNSLHIGRILKSNTSNTITYRWDFLGTGETDIPGTLRIRPKTGSYTEGIRIYPNASWTTIMLGGNDMTATSGTSANSWGIFNNNGTFYINKNASSAAGAPRVMGTSTGWTFGNTSTNSYPVNAPQMYADTWMRAGTGFYVHDKGVHYMSNGQSGQGQIYLTSNEFNWQASSTSLYFNYRAGSNGTTVTKYIWNAGSSSSWAEHEMGILRSTKIFANKAGSPTDGGISLYSTTDPMTYGVVFRQTASYGKLGRVQGDWATYFTMNDTTNRGWIFRAGSNYASISSRGEAYFTSVGTDGFIMNPSGGRLAASSPSSRTGALCIQLPVSWTNTMLSFDVIIYNYSTGTSCVYHVGGYNYSSNSAWYNVTAYASRSGTAGLGNLTVRFGHNGTYCCIYIGETNTTWNYPQVSIANLQLGYSNIDFNRWAAGWGISWVTSFGTITQTVTNTAINYYADTWDGYHLVVGSTGTAANTIYIL